MSLFNKKRDQSKKFTELTADASDEKKRQGELDLLKPEPLENYEGEVPKHKSDLERRTILMVFKDESQIELVKKIFDVRGAEITNKFYVTDISILETLARVADEVAQERVKQELKQLDDHIEEEVQKRVNAFHEEQAKAQKPIDPEELKPKRRTLE